MIQSFIQNLIIVFVSGTVLFLFMVTNWLLGTFYNTISLEYKFNKKKFYNGLLKFMTVLLALLLKITALTLAAAFLSEYFDTTLLNIAGTLTIFGKATIDYYKKSDEHLKNIIDYKGVGFDEGKH